MALFLFKKYEFNSIENFTLTSLWNFTFNLKFKPEKFVSIKFNHFLRNIMEQLTTFPPPLLLKVQEVVDVLDLDLGT